MITSLLLVGVILNYLEKDFAYFNSYYKIKYPLDSSFSGQSTPYYYSSDSLYCSNSLILSLIVGRQFEIC